MSDGIVMLLFYFNSHAKSDQPTNQSVNKAINQASEEADLLVCKLKGRPVRPDGSV